MSRPVRARLDGLAERHPRLATAWWAAAGLLGACWLLAVVAALVGFGLGAPGPADPAPSVDFGEGPATVVANATGRLSHRDYTVEEWVRTVDRRDGSVAGGMFYRFHVESSRGQLRGQLQPARATRTEGLVGEGPPREAFVAPGAAWVRLGGQAYWQRSRSARALVRDALAFRNVTPARLASANLTVVADNESTYVAEGSLAGVPGARPDAVGTVRYVVAKGEDPHLRTIRYRRAGRMQTTTRVVRVLDHGDAIAPRPRDVPWTTVDECWRRVGRGLDRLAAVPNL